MEPIPSWSEERVSEWLQGLDAPLHQYPVSEWRLSGLDLLQLTSQDLERLGVQKIGHQELVLEAVEKLCSLTYGIGGENLRGLTEKMRAVAHSLQMGIQNRWRLNSYDGRSTTKLPASVLQVVVELIASAKGLFSMLTRHQSFQHSGSTFSKHIFSYCKDLGDIVHRDATVYEKEKDIISVCRQLVGACDEILNDGSEALLAHSAQIESVDLVPVSPGDQLGIEITSTSSTNHYVSGAASETSNDSDVKILAGDEVIQVNDQVVVGWSRENLVKKLRENPNGVTLVLKRLPGTAQPQRKDSIPRLTTTPDDEEEEKYEDENPRQSVLERVAASVRSLSFRKGPEIQQQFIGRERSEPSPELERSLSVSSSHSQQGGLSPLSASGDFEGLDSSKLSPALRRRAQTSSSRSASPLHLGSFRSSSPLSLASFRSPSPLRSASFRSSSPQLANQDTASISSCPEMVGHTGNKDTKKSSTKGMSTALSRRRVSCRELGKPDCDGWLWKKRKESGVFITHKWQRFWFILKGPSLYWYTTQQAEKAEGLVNVASYSIESAGEHKRKYVFKMSHKRFQNFFFAADTVSDMSKWINCLIAAIQKHRKFQGPDSEEECYSETESESERSPSPHRANKDKKVQSNTLPRPKGKTKVPQSNPPAGGRKGTGAAEDEMSVMMNSIKEGGVSLIGHDQPLTHDHFRKSFIKRNKNPVINEFAHRLRTLESTLKAKEAELQQINKLLGDSSLTASKYRQWKEKNEELLLDIEKHCPPKTSKGGDKSAAQDTPAKEAALETVATETGATETKGAYRLSLSDGEQLVDAEPEVQKEIPEGSPSPGGSPVLELSLGSLQESINKRLSEMAESGAAADNYFYI